MAVTVKFLIFAHGNVVRGEEGVSYDRDPLRKIRLKTDATFTDLLNAIHIGVKIDPTTQQIKVHHRHPSKSVEGRVHYSLVPILDDDDVKDLIEMAENMGEGYIQELYVEISDGSIALSEHETQQVVVTKPSTSQMARSRRDPMTEIEDFTPKRARYEMHYFSKDINNIEQEVNRVPEDSPVGTGKNLAVADLRNEDPSQHLMIHELRDPRSFPMPPTSSSMDIANKMEDGNQPSRASSSITPLHGQDYEVFLSFRGEDTRRGFTDHIYNGLVNVGVKVFRDNNELRVDEEIGPDLLKAIKGSRISIPVISENYASSSWCLKELVQILECRKTSGQVVLPIFYQVEPSEVRRRTGRFGYGFLESKKKHYGKESLIRKWNKALEEVASLKGWGSSKIANGHEGELVNVLVRKVLQVLNKVALPVCDHLVGVEHHVEKIIEWTSNSKQSCNSQAILIYGMGGIGKTTLAKVVYNQLFDHFECCSFIRDIRAVSQLHKGIEDLQRQLISNILGQNPHISNVEEGANIIKARCNKKKVLVLLDDIDHRDQLNALVGRGDWFGSGSIIIITSRIKVVIEKWECIFTYELNGLDTNQSFILFCKHAFKRGVSVPNEYNIIAKKIASTTGGLPLAIEVIGSLLCGKKKDFWEGSLKKLEKILHHEVQSKLKISFDALEFHEKEIFLDIACLPIHQERDGGWVPGKKVAHYMWDNQIEFAFHMWDSCAFYPHVAIENLISMSFIKIGEKAELIIHDQLRDLGREIVRQESIRNLGKRSRLWKQEAWEVLELNQGTGRIQTLNLSRFYNEKEVVRCTSEQFEKMIKLRYLALGGVPLEGDFKNIFPHLRWFQWTPNIFYKLPFNIMGINFVPRRLVILDLHEANITECWEGWSQIKNLKVLKLQFCHSLTATPDFSVMKDLEVLILKSCKELKSIHPSLGKLRKTLKILKVDGCRQLEELPIEVGELEELNVLNIHQAPIRKIPISEGCMRKLETLSASHCTKLEDIPDSVGSLTNLRTLVLSECPWLRKIPESIGKLELLTKLDLSRTGITQLPDAIGDLRNLESLHLSSTSLRCLPTSIQMLSKLQVLDLSGCYQLEQLSNLPCSLMSLEFSGNKMETLPDFSNSTNLEHLQFTDNFKKWNRALNFRNLNQMRSLHFKHSMVNCVSYSKMVRVWGFPDSYEDFNFVQREVSKNINILLELPLRLVDLTLEGCDTLRTLPDFSNLKNLSLLHIKDCPELTKINGLDGAESLTHVEILRCRKLAELNGMGSSVMNLKLEDLNSLASLPDLSTAKKLKDLKIHRCGSLVEIRGLNNADNIKSVIIDGCSSLERIGNLSNLKMLAVLKLHSCKKLSDVQGIENLTSLTSVSFSGCHPKITFRDLFNA